MNQVYVEGFIRKCAEAGIDAEELVKRGFTALELAAALGLTVPGAMTGRQIAKEDGYDTAGQTAAGIAGAGVGGAGALAGAMAPEAARSKIKMPKFTDQYEVTRSKMILDELQRNLEHARTRDPDHHMDPKAIEGEMKSELSNLEGLKQRARDISAKRKGITSFKKTLPGKAVGALSKVHSGVGAAVGAIGVPAAAYGAHKMLSKDEPEKKDKKKEKKEAAYIEGFIAKCAEAGIDPEALIKEAQRGMQLAKGLRRVGKDKLLDFVQVRNGDHMSAIQPTGTELATNLEMQAGKDANLAKYLGRRGKTAPMQMSTGLERLPNAPQVGDVDLAELATMVREKLLARKVSDRMAGRAVMKGIKHPNA